MAYRTMLVLCFLCPAIAFVPRLSTFRRAFPAMQRWKRHRLYLMGSVMVLFWALALIIGTLFVVLPGQQQGAGGGDA